MTFHEELYENGIVVVSIPHFTSRLTTLRSGFEDAIVNQFPEFIKHPRLNEIRKDYEEGNVARYVMGGTSFAGNPSVFHAPFFRQLRLQVFSELIQLVFRNYKNDYLNSNVSLEMILDRVLIRPAGDLPTRESWHRDESPYASPEQGDIVFGGWLNLDLEPQYFSCAIGSHRGIDPTKRGTKGFNKLSPEEVATFEANKRIIEIPPGGLIVFNEDLAHEILINRQTKKTFTSIRLFHGFRFTPQSGLNILGRDLLLRLLEEQSVIPIKSGQIPAVYPASANMFPLQRQNKERFIREMLGGEQVLNLRTRSFKSLREIGCGMHPPYEEYEINALFSNTTFELPNAETGLLEQVNI
jgi:hypothetical protein